MVKSNYYKTDIIDFKFYHINQNYNYWASYDTWSNL